MIDPTKSDSTQPYRTTPAAHAIRKEILSLDALVDLIQKSWPERYERGRILHVHRNGIRLPNGTMIHLRVMVQQIAQSDPVYSEEI